MNLERPFLLLQNESGMVRNFVLEGETTILEPAQVFNEAAWEQRLVAKPYVVGRMLWMRLALDCLDRGANRRATLGRLKTVLQDEASQMDWTMEPVLDHLQPKLSEADHALLTALVAAMSDRSNLPALEAFEAWRATKPEPFD